MVGELKPVEEKAFGEFDYLTQLQTLKTVLDAQIRAELEKKYQARIGWLAIHTAHLIQSASRSLFEMRRMGKFIDSTKQSNLGIIYESVANLRELCTLLGLGSYLGVLSWKFYPESNKASWQKLEKARLEVEKVHQKADRRVQKALKQPSASTFTPPLPPSAFPAEKQQRE